MKSRSHSTGQSLHGQFNILHDRSDEFHIWCHWIDLARSTDAGISHVDVPLARNPSRHSCQRHRRYRCVPARSRQTMCRRPLGSICVSRKATNPANPARHLMFRDLVLRCWAVRQKSHPVAVRWCSKCSYGGVPASFPIPIAIPAASG